VSQAFEMGVVQLNARCVRSTTQQPSNNGRTEQESFLVSPGRVIACRLTTFIHFLRWV